MSRSSCYRYGLLAVLGGALLNAAPARADYALEKAFPQYTFVFGTDIQPANDGSNRLFVVEKRGIIWVFASDVQSNVKHEFLNISTKVRASGEAGLLGLAFHPDYRTNGWFYVFYVTQYPYRTIIARYQVSQNPDAADPASELVLIDNPQATLYHNGGQLAFGPDGMLYIGIGDNFSSATAQDLADLPGSILRIDVNVSAAATALALNYKIPADNPFANNTQGYREEIYAYGFRNPWRFCIDKVTGELWASDVGEDTYEEIDLVEKGRNYGWPLMEGPACFGGPCDPVGDNLVLPLYSYTHAEGSAVIGGYRYWGRRVPELAGYYIFADYTGGEVWGLRYDGAAGPERFDLVTNAPELLTFGLGPTGDLLAASSDGYLYHLDRIVTSTPGSPPAETRLIDNYPNPFNPTTTIHYRLARTSAVEIDIVAVDGRRVAHYDLGTRPAGEHRVEWNGRTASGAAASGVYFCRLRVDGAPAGTIRMTLLK